MICGNFNIHEIKENDPGAKFFSEIMHALGFCQHLTFPTHNAENTFDIVLQKFSINLRL